MPDVCQDQPIFCLEEIVVFVVSGDIYIGSLSYCGRSEEGSGTAADGYFPDLRFTDFLPVAGKADYRLARRVRR